MDWEVAAERGAARWEDGRRRLPADGDARQKQLVRMAMAAGAAGLARLMQERDDEAHAWLERSAEAYRGSWEDAPPGSWGRPIGLLKSLVLAGEITAAVEAATWTTSLEPQAGESPIGLYAATLAELVLGNDARAEEHAARLAEAPEDAFPPATASALAALARHEAGRYAEALALVLRSFEERTEFLEDIPVADTVLVLEALAERRGMAVRPRSALLPARAR